MRVGQLKGVLGDQVSLFADVPFTMLLPLSSSALPGVRHFFSYRLTCQVIYPWSASPLVVTDHVCRQATSRDYPRQRHSRERHYKFFREHVLVLFVSHIKDSIMFIVLQPADTQPVRRREREHVLGSTNHDRDTRHMALSDQS